jgi:hypothetical protein
MIHNNNVIFDILCCRKKELKVTFDRSNPSPTGPRVADREWKRWKVVYREWKRRKKKKTIEGSDGNSLCKVAVPCHCSSGRLAVA